MTRPAANPPDVTGPHRVRQRRTRGWRMPPGTVSVARPGPWGNPYRVGQLLPGRDAPLTAADAVALYTTHTLTQPGYLDSARAALAGKNLACWCPLTNPDGTAAPCHADVLLHAVNNPASRDNERP